MSSGAETAAGCGALDGAEVGTASIAVGEEGCTDGETGAPSAVSRPAGAAVVMISAADPACVGVTAASGPRKAGVLVVERALWTGAARGSATAFAIGGVRTSTVDVAAGTDATCVAAGALASGGDCTVCCTGGLPPAASDRTICGGFD